MDLWSETGSVYVKQEPTECRPEVPEIEYHSPEYGVDGNNYNYGGDDYIRDDEEDGNKDIDIKYHPLEDSWKDTTIQDLLESYDNSGVTSTSGGELFLRNQFLEDKSNLLSTLQRLALRVETTESIYGEEVLASSILPPDKPGGHFKCEACNRCYRYKHTLKQHVDIECGKEPQHKCPECDRRFKQMQNLKSHFTGQHSDKMWIPFPKSKSKSANKKGAYCCEGCGKCYQSKDTLKSHMMRFCYNRNRFQCAQCPYYSKRLWQLKRHINKIHNSRPKICRHVSRRRVAPFDGPRFDHQCPDCDKSYRQAHELHRHRRLECRLELPAIACDLCHLEAALRTNSPCEDNSAILPVANSEVAVKLEPLDPESPTALDTNIRPAKASKLLEEANLAPPRKRYSCPKCQRYFWKVARLSDHECGSTYKCDHCHVVRRDQRAIIHHLKSQHPEAYGKPPIGEWSGRCENCNRPFTVKAKLARHIYYCSAVELKCPIPGCEYTSKVKQTMQLHVLSGKHTNQSRAKNWSPKPWACQICNRSYRDKGSFMKHVRYKCGKNPRYPCANCPRSYRDKNGLSRHLMYECGKEPQLQCPHCPYRAKRNYSLNSHMVNRHNAQPKRPNPY